MRQQFRVKGQVQGIGYRFFVVQAAQKLSLTGWVRNCSNGDVECEVQGKKEAIEIFVRHLETGHTFARVENIFKEPIPDRSKEEGFDIRF